jgi:hypothetical protein
MHSSTDKSETSRLVVCATCGRPNRIPLTATAANCGECKTPLDTRKSDGVQMPTPSSESASAQPVKAAEAAPSAVTVSPSASVPSANRVSSGTTKVAPPHKSIQAEEIKTSNTGIGWIVAAIAGAIGISAFSGSASTARYLIPCSIMSVYFLWGWQQDSQNKEKLADSLYFLGFIWTLYALIDALLKGAGQAKDANALFTTFGYALVTTGLGMFLRMVVIQLGYSAPEQLQDTRDAVAEGLEQFSVHLREAQNALVISRNQFTKTAEAWVAGSQEVSKAMREASAQTTETARTAVERVAAGLQGVSTAVDACGESSKIASRAVSSLAKRVATSGEKLEESLEKASSEAADALTDAATRLSEVHIPSNVVATHLSRLVDEMVAPSKSLLASLENIAASAGTAQGKISQISETTVRDMSEMSQSLQRLAVSIQGTEQSTDRLRAALSEISVQSATLAKSTGQLIDIQSALANRLNALQAQLRQTTPQPARVEDVSGARRVWPWG